MHLYSMVSNFSELTDIPRAPDGAWYVFPILDEWETTTNKAFRENLVEFSRAINPSVLVPLNKDNLRTQFFESSGAHEKDAPLLFLTPLHPNEWATLGSDDRFLQLRLGALSNESNTIRFLKRLAATISNGSNSMATVQWSHRVEIIRRAAEHVPILNLVGLAQ